MCRDHSLFAVTVSVSKNLSGRELQAAKNSANDPPAATAATTGPAILQHFSEAMLPTNIKKTVMTKP